MRRTCNARRATRCSCLPACVRLLSSPGQGKSAGQLSVVLWIYSRDVATYLPPSLFTTHSPPPSLPSSFFAPFCGVLMWHWERLARQLARALTGGQWHLHFTAILPRCCCKLSCCCCCCSCCCSHCIGSCKTTKRELLFQRSEMENVVIINWPLQE